MPIDTMNIGTTETGGYALYSVILPVSLIISLLIIILLTISLLYYKRRFRDTQEGLVCYICVYLQLKDQIPADKCPVINNLSDPVTPDEFIKIIHKMMKRMLLMPLFFVFILPLSAQNEVPEAVKADSVYEFRFVPRKDMFFIPYGDNRAELERLSSLVTRYREAIISGQMPLFMDAYCNSMSGEAENKAVARTRANRVKSELIHHQGLTEKCFVTHNHAGKGDWVTVRIRVTAPHHTKIPATAPVENEVAAEIAMKDKALAMEEVVVTETAAQETGEQNLVMENLVGTGISEKSIYTLSMRANLLRWATLTPDLGIEWRINRHVGILVGGSWTSWSWDNKNRRYAMWKVSPEVRYYIGKEKRGFLGAMYHIGEFNYKLGDTGKQGDYQGGGITGGYMLPLNRSLALDFHAAVGYTRAEYDKYKVIDRVRVRQGCADKSYWGINQLGVTLVWKFVK